MEDKRHMKGKEELIAPCGMNCRICVSYFGYTLNGKKRKTPCTGCRPKDKQCTLKKKCDRLTNKTAKYCFECEDFPCENLEKLDERYREKYGMSMIENLKFIKGEGIDSFLIQQEEKYKCPECGGLLCVHNGVCYSCKNPQS